jgi:hypothetical protein
MIESEHQTEWEQAAGNILFVVGISTTAPPITAVCVGDSIAPPSLWIREGGFSLGSGPIDSRSGREGSRAGGRARNSDRGEGEGFVHRGWRWCSSRLTGCIRGTESAVMVRARVEGRDEDRRGGRAVRVHGLERRESDAVRIGMVVGLHGLHDARETGETRGRWKEWVLLQRCTSQTRLQMLAPFVGRLASPSSSFCSLSPVLSLLTAGRTLAGAALPQATLSRLLQSQFEVLSVEPARTPDVDSTRRAF